MENTILSTNLVPSIKQVEPSTIFYQGSNTNTPILELKANGDILVKGKLIENDKQVVDALREFLKGQGY